MELETLIEIMEISVKRNGPDYPLTLSHLLNILKMVERRCKQTDDPAGYNPDIEDLN